MNAKEFLDRHEDDVLTVIPYGSQVYGTANQNSDWDYIAIARDEGGLQTGHEFRGNKLNVTSYKKADFQRQLNDHKIHTLEAFFYPHSTAWSTFEFELNLKRLRHSLSEKASHSFVKAKKKIDVEKEYYIGWKSLFHALRILNFGIQIATSGTINDFSAANNYWFDIQRAQQYNWDYFKDVYQPVYNRLRSEFAELAPK